MKSKWLEALESTLQSYPASAKSKRRSRVIENHGHYELVFSFNKSRNDQTDRLLIEFVASRVGAEPCNNTDNRSGSVCFRCDEAQAKSFGRYLAYATNTLTTTLGTSATEKRVPLHVLFTRAITQFTSSYEAKPTKQARPSLAMWSNVLRVVPTGGFTAAEFSEASILASRTAKVVINHGLALGWLQAKPPKPLRANTRFSLTPLGIKVRNSGKRRVAQIESSWSNQFGKSFESCRDSLLNIVGNFDLEYPYYVSGYGPADESLTGGDYLPAEEEPIFVPGRGQEWPVVPRDVKKSNSTLPFCALLNQALTQFALDYEHKRQGRLGLTTMFFQYLQDDGMTLEEARQLQAMNGKGTSLHERHMNVVVEPGKPSDGSRMVFPTQKTRIARDVYPTLVEEIESEWESKYGKRRVQSLRKFLESMSEQWSSDLPDYPDTTAWMIPHRTRFQIVK